MAPAGVRSGSPELPYLKTAISGPSAKRKPAGGNLHSKDHCDPVSSKSHRKKSKLRKEEIQEVVLEQIRNIVKENEQLRRKLLQLSQKSEDNKSRGHR